MQRYADNMDWIVTVIEDDRQRLIDGAATSAFDLVLCWRTGDLRDAEFRARCSGEPKSARSRPSMRP